MGPDATQPRVTVRPKPPVLLGATSETHRRLRYGIVSDNPVPGLVRRLQGSHHSVTRYACRRKLLPAPAASPLRNSMPTLDPALRPSLGHLRVRLAASLPASLRPALRRSVGVRRASISELVHTLLLASQQGQCDFAKSRRSPHLFLSHPQRDLVNPQLFPIPPVGLLTQAARRARRRDVLRAA